MVNAPPASIMIPMPARRGLFSIRWILYAAALIALAAAAFGVTRLLRTRVVVTTIVEGPVIRAVYATGTVQPEREFPIRAPNEGTLEKVLVDKGSVVKAGDALAEIVDPALIYAVDRAQAELNEKLARVDEKTSPVLAEFDARIPAARQQLDIALREEKRLKQTLETGAGSQTDVDRAADRVQMLWATLESWKSQRAAKLLELQREVDFARSALKTATWKLDQQKLVSPIDGVVLDRPTSQGTRVAVNDTIMRLADVRPDVLVMRAAVDEEDITSVHVGQKVIMTLYAFDRAKFEGKVRTIYSEADPNRRTFEVDIEFLVKSERLQPGMTGELAFVVEEKDRAMILPSQAVKDGFVYVVRGGKIVRLKPEIGVAAVDRVEVKGGLDPADRVIISPLTSDMEGKPAGTTDMDPREAAGLNKPDQDKPFNPMR